MGIYPRPPTWKDSIHFWEAGLVTFNYTRFYSSLPPSSSCSSNSSSLVAQQSGVDSVLEFSSDITATANTPRTPVKHPPINVSIFPIRSSLGIISSVIESLPYYFKYSDRYRYGWSPTHTVFPPLLCPRMRTFRTCPRRMMILSGGPRIGPRNFLVFIASPFWLVETKRGTIGPRTVVDWLEWISAQESCPQAV